MNLDLGWWLGAPVLGGGALAATILTPRFRRDRNRSADDVLPAGVLPVAERTRNRATAPAAPVAEAAEAPVDVPDASIAEPADADGERVESEAPAQPKFSFRPRLGQHFAGVRNLVRRAQRGARSAHDSEERTVVDEVHADLFGEHEGTGEPQLYDAQSSAEPLAFVASAGEDALRTSAPPLAVAATTEPAIAASETIFRIVLAAVMDDDAGVRARVAENGIMDLNQIPGATDSTPVNIAEWQAATAAREAQLTEELARVEALRQQAQSVLTVREAEAAAVAQKRDLERAAVVEETRVRAEARARKWYARLDLDIDVPTLKERMVLATSLGVVKASWAGKMLRIAFTEEEEPRVRARIIGALATGNHLDDATPFTVAFQHGGIERAAVVEVLLPRQGEASWIAELLLLLAAAQTARSLP